MALIIAYLALAPLVFLLWRTFTQGGTPSFASFRLVYTEEGGGKLADLILTTFEFAAGSTAIAVIIGTMLAYLSERTDIPLRRTIFIGALVPQLIPGILYATSWVILGGPESGVLNVVAEHLFGIHPFNVFTLPSLIVIQGLDSVPIAYLLMYAAFRRMDPALENAGLMCGASHRQVFSRITLPAIMPALATSALLIVLINASSFEIPAIIGMPGGVWVLTSRIWFALDSLPPEYGVAGVYCLLLLILCAVGVYLYSRFSKRSASYQTVTGKGLGAQRVRLRGRLRYIASGAVVLYTAGFVGLPVIAIAYESMAKYFTSPSFGALTHLTASNYGALWDSDVMRSAMNSAALGVGAATVVMLLGAVASWLTLRTNIRGRFVIDALTFFPLVIPGLVLGVAMLFLYLRFRIGLYGTLWILLVAYCTRFLPYGMRYMSASLFQVGVELEESAEICGASWLQSLRRIILPLVRPGFIAGWLFVFMLAVRELGSSILLYSPGHEVLAITMWQQYSQGNLGELSALGVVVMVCLALLMLPARKIASRVGGMDGA